MAYSAAFDRALRTLAQELSKEPPGVTNKGPHRDVCQISVQMIHFEETEIGVLGPLVVDR